MLPVSVDLIETKIRPWQQFHSRRNHSKAGHELMGDRNTIIIMIANVLTHNGTLGIFKTWWRYKPSSLLASVKWTISLWCHILVNWMELLGRLRPSANRSQEMKSATCALQYKSYVYMKPGRLSLRCATLHWHDSRGVKAGFPCGRFL